MHIVSTLNGQRSTQRKEIHRRAVLGSVSITTETRTWSHSIIQFSYESQLRPRKPCNYISPLDLTKIFRGDTESYPAIIKKYNFARQTISYGNDTILQKKKCLCKSQ